MKPVESLEDLPTFKHHFGNGAGRSLEDYTDGQTLAIHHGAFRDMDAADVMRLEDGAEDRLSD